MTRSNSPSRILLALGIATCLLGCGFQRDAEQHQTGLHTRELDHQDLGQMFEDYRSQIEMELEDINGVIERRVLREELARQESGEAAVRDFLIVSGGGAKGAFGAGFLQGWGEVEGPLSRPDFDVVTGVSTGALIAPFAFLGSDEDYASIADLYGNPQDNWIRKRGRLYLLPHHVSLYDNSGLRESVRGAFDAATIERIAERAAENRLLLIGATHLDLGVGRVFDLGREAASALETGDQDRVHKVLLASSALPGVFPPIEIDGAFYADGGISSQLFILTTLEQVEGPVSEWLAEHPAAPQPDFRIWVIVNEPLGVEPSVTQPTWPSVAQRSILASMRSSLVFALRHIHDIAEGAEDLTGFNVEFRFVSIPEQAPQNTSGDLFDRDYMVALEELGRKMGRDPESWKTTVGDPQWFDVH